MKTQTFETDCDMGSIKIFNDSMSVFFMNNIGDFPNTVTISNKQTNKKKSEFLGHFTVKTKAFLSGYDCDDTPLFTFPKGRWFVELVGDSHFYIYKCDNDIHA
jgi:hypothetical protein